MVKCKICDKAFKRLTLNHLRTHGYNLDLYNKEFEPELHRKKILLNFLNEYYIDVRSRFLEYKNGATYTVNTKKSECKRTWSLCDNDIKQHLNGEKTIGILFPKDSSKLIGLDVDTKELDVLNRLYNAIRNYGIPEECLLITSSGGKGYHLDIFLNDYLDKKIINQFYSAILNEVEQTKTIIELRGGGGQGWKLPFGYHQTTKNECYACDEWGNKIEFEPEFTRRLDPEIIADIVDIDLSEVSINKSDAELIHEYTKLDDSVIKLTSHSRTNEKTIIEVERLLEFGVHEIGKRHNSILTVAAYSKDYLNNCITDTILLINNWISNTWNKAIIDKETLKSVKIIVKSVFKTNFKFKVHANKIDISLPDIKEIFSVKAKNQLQTDALRKLYYIFMLQSKAYKSNSGNFYLSYKQIAKMGGNKNAAAVLKQINKLVSMGKIEIIERNRNAGSSGNKFKKPNIYNLPKFISFEIETNVFHMCEEMKCKDCLNKAACFLARTEKERRTFVKGEKFKRLEQCEYNPRAA